MRSIATFVSASVLAMPFVLAPSATVSAQEDLQSKLVTIEKKLWEGWKNRDAKPFEEHVTKDTVSINAQGITSGKAQVIKDITSSDCDVKGFSLSDVQVHPLGKDSALLTYKAAQDAICKGQKIPAQVLVSSTYVNEGGVWREASYRETPVPK